jgi:dienelactone hydrolase
MPAGRPHLSFDAAPDDPVAMVLTLHGGREAGLGPVRPSQLAVLRMVPIARRIARLGARRLVVARLRYRVRGWNGAEQSPVGDARWALDQLTSRFGELPIGLVGHSMGGRTALRVGGYPGVRSIVALAPWLPPGEPIAQLTGRRILLAHGSDDRMTSPKGTAALANQLRQAGIACSFVEISGERHGMLKQPRLWHDLTAGFLISTLLNQSDTGRVPNLLQRVIEGEPRITV